MRQRPGENGYQNKVIELRDPSEKESRQIFLILSES